MFYYTNHQPHKEYALIGKLIDLIEAHQLKENNEYNHDKQNYERHSPYQN
jgi:hypothetical protein